jgi:hypothetical protein
VRFTFKRISQLRASGDQNRENKISIQAPVKKILLPTTPGSKASCGGANSLFGIDTLTDLRL